MKKAILFIIASLFSVFSFAGELVLIRTGSMETTRELFTKDNLTIHHFTDHFVIGILEGYLGGSCVVLDEYPWQNGNERYYILYSDEDQQPGYREAISTSASILFEEPGMMIVSTTASHGNDLYPVIHGGMVRISPDPARLPSPARFTHNRSGGSRSQAIQDMLDEVNADSLEATVQHLQDYGTRNAYEPESVEAQNWIFDKFESYGLDVELHDFWMPSGEASDNVIATLTGTTYPEEYVVLGSHYDSYAWGSSEPGADDNATGTAGILEAARIMSQFEFERTIIFCTWSGEEYGLYGSDAWATEAAQNGMNILGYFNIDMAGYLEPGGEIHTDMIAPLSAQPLVDFYTDVCAEYLPDFQINAGNLTGGDSDHTSFNQNGFMGIFPFEDSDNYSPYIHTDNDLIGPSVNNFEQHSVFTKATIASVATMAGMTAQPTNLVAVAGDEVVDLSWVGVEAADYYFVYRDDDSAPYDVTTETTYTDTTVLNATPYTYWVTAFFGSSGTESDPTNQVTVVPLAPIGLPYYDDFETGGYYWTFQGSWGLEQGTYHSAEMSLTESVGGNYAPNTDNSAILRPIDFTQAFDAVVSFWTKYQIQSGVDQMHLEVSTDGSTWTEIASYTGTSTNWTLKTYSLNQYLGEPEVTVRFHFTSDDMFELGGMYIDDFEIDISGVGLDDIGSSTTNNSLSVHPNPVSGQATLRFTLEKACDVSIGVYDVSGRMVINALDAHLDSGLHELKLDTDNLPGGVYQCNLVSADRTESVKILIVK